MPETPAIHVWLVRRSRRRSRMPKTVPAGNSPHPTPANKSQNREWDGGMFTAQGSSSSGGLCSGGVSGRIYKSSRGRSSVWLLLINCFFRPTKKHQVPETIPMADSRRDRIVCNRLLKIISATCSGLWLDPSPKIAGFQLSFVSCLIWFAALL